MTGDAAQAIEPVSLGSEPSIGFEEDSGLLAHPSDDPPEPQVGGIDAKFTEDEYEAMLAEVRDYLPAFLSPAASEHHDPVGDVKELLRLDSGDLERVLAVHVCLSEEVTRFSEGLARGLRRPLISTERPEHITQAVRGPIDWGATIRRRSLTGWDPTVFVVRPGERIFDTPENQALAWALDQLEIAVSRVAGTLGEDEPDAQAAAWKDRLAMLAGALRRARRVEWLRNVTSHRPTPRVRQRLAATRLDFYRSVLTGVITLLLRVDDPDAETLTDVLCQRYFEPHRAWKLFEILVALRLAREFAKPKHSTTLRRTRLLAGGENVEAYARYGLADGGEVWLIYQGWPARKTKSLRQDTAKRHGFTPKSSIPDLFIVRTDADGGLVDTLILELKATKRPGYLGEGLSQLLSYLAERPELFPSLSSGWLVAPKSEAFHAYAADPEAPLWIVTADQVATSAAARIVP